MFPDTNHQESVQLKDNTTESTSITTDPSPMEVENRIVEAETPNPEAPSADEAPNLPVTELNGEEETKKVQLQDSETVETPENHS